MRGDFVIIAIQGDYGKPRPALVIQSDQFEELGSITVLPITSTTTDAPLIRIPVKPNKENGLQKESQIMIDKIVTIKREKVAKSFGRCDQATMLKVQRSLAVFIGIG